MLNIDMFSADQQLRTACNLLLQAKKKGKKPAAGDKKRDDTASNIVQPFDTWIHFVTLFLTLWME